MTHYSKLTRLFTFILILPGMVQLSYATRSEPDPLLGQHYLLKIITDLELYQNGQGKSNLDQQLKNHLTQFRSHFDPLLLEDSGLPDATRLELKQLWQQVARNLGALLVTVQQGGFIDQEIRYQYQEQMTLLWNQLYELTVSRIALQNEEKLVLLLQQANLRYLNPNWKLAPYEQESLVDLVQIAEPQIARLEWSQPESRAQFQQKWPLLRQGLLQEDRAMGFLVKRYSNDLVSLLLSQLNLLASSDNN